MQANRKVEARKIRHVRVRRLVQGTAQRPRLVVFRSLNHIYAQVIDDTSGRTLAAVDSRAPDFRQKVKAGGNVAAAKLRALRKPDPYKGKGIKYADEHIRRKVGKKAGAK